MNSFQDDNRNLKTIYHEPMIKHDSLVDGVIVPGLQCIITGFTTGLCFGVLSGLMGGHGWRIFAGVFVLATWLAWLAYRAGWNSRLERMLHIDLNGDGVIGGQPVPAVQNDNPLRVLLSRNDPEEMSGEDATLPHRELLPQLADGLLRGRAFSQREWAKEISQPTFYDIQRAFIAAGLAKPANGKNGAQGYELNKKGIDTCLAIANRAREERNNTPSLPYFRGS